MPSRRYDEIVESMKKVMWSLSVGYKNVLGARRASWSILSSIEQKEESKGNEQNVKRIREYQRKVEDEQDLIFLLSLTSISPLPLALVNLTSSITR